MVDKILKWKLLKLAFILKLWLVKKFYETALMLLKKKSIFVFHLPNFILFSLFSYINFYHMTRTQSNFLLTDIWKLQVNFTFHWWMVTEYTWEGGRREETHAEDCSTQNSRNFQKTRKIPPRQERWKGAAEFSGTKY